MTQTLIRKGTGSFKKGTDSFKKSSKISKALSKSKISKPIKPTKPKPKPKPIIKEEEYKEAESSIELEPVECDVSTDTEVEIDTDVEDVVEIAKVKTEPIPNKRYYFDNPKVESLLLKYVQGGCVDVALRDEIMGHAAELIRQIIRAHNFEQIFPGRDSSSFNELFQVAWMQIEKVLYKYDSRPNSPKVFNMWSQIAKTRILAYLKKEKRDKKNVAPYRDFLIRKHKTKSRFQEEFKKFIEEARHVCQFNDEFLEIIDKLEHIYKYDEKAYDGLITKLEKRTGKSRNMINQFFKTLRMRSDEFTINMIDIRDGRENDFSSQNDEVDSD